MSICDENEIAGDADYMKRLLARVTQEHVPLSGTIALTDRCNLRCIHCYARTPQHGGGLQAVETDTAGHLRTIDEITRAGCLYLLLTGGEPLLRPDFSEIYAHAKKSGLHVSIFTNGTLVTDSILALFADLPPRKVEISIYGATAATHDGITGIPGSFTSVHRGIERLAQAGIIVNLKTIVMTRNLAEFAAMEKMAKDYGAKFRFDPCIFPRMDGDSGPLALRISPDEIVKIDFADPERVDSWRHYFKTRSGVASADRLYGCGAGVTSFWIDAYGTLQPCVMTRRGRVNIAKRGFEAAWQGIVAQMAGTGTPAQFSCNACTKKALCGYCPGFFELESGSETKRSEFLCTLGQRRLEFLGKETPEEALRAL